MRQREEMKRRGGGMDREIVARYTNQPARMPAGARTAIEAVWNDGPVQLYALADLDAKLRLSETWVALGPEHLAVARRRAIGGRNGNDGNGEDGGTGGARTRHALNRGAAGHDRRDGNTSGEWEIHSVPRSSVRAVSRSPGLSGTVLSFLAEPDEPPLATVRYTHRQRRAMENLRFVVQEQLRGRCVEPEEPDETYAESVAAPIREAQALVAGSRVAVIWRLLGYLRPYRREWTIGLAAAGLITLASLIPPYLTGYLLDDVVGPVRNGTLDLSRATLAGWVAVGAMALVYAVQQAGAFVRLRTLSLLGEWVARDLRTELYEHLQRLSLSFYTRKETGSIITRVISDTDRLWNFFASDVVDASLSLVRLTGLGIVLLSLDWKLGLVMTAPVPLYCWAIYQHWERIQRLCLRAGRKWSRVTGVLSDTIPGVRVVKTFNQEKRETRRFDGRNVSAMEAFNHIHGTWTAFWPRLMLAVYGTTVAVWAFALPRLLEGPGAEPSLSAGTFVSFLLYTTMFIGPVEIIGRMARTMSDATSSAHRIFEVLDTKPEIVEKPRPVRLEPLAGRVSFDSVTFAYDGVRQVLRGVSFDVRPGEVIGLVGPSGGGKTTVVNLIARFYDTTGGAIRIDGVDIRSLEVGHYRRQMGMVLQDPYLFHGTVIENIRYGHPEADLERVIEAARAANAHDFICRLPHGYDTVVGERGQTLSGGERQRVSIARAILHDPRILILDEATSAVDTETERKIQEALDRLVAGRTVFAIAHRLSTLYRASRLFVMKNGRLAEAGTHEELLANPDGIYRRLHEMQLELQRPRQGEN